MRNGERFKSYAARKMEEWEARKVLEWRERGVLKPDGSLRVGRIYSRRKRGRPNQRLLSMDIAEIACLLGLTQSK